MDAKSRASRPLPCHPALSKLGLGLLGPWLPTFRLGWRARGTVAGSGRSLGLGVRGKAQVEGVCLPYLEPACLPACLVDAPRMLLTLAVCVCVCVCVCVQACAPSVSVRV